MYYYLLFAIENIIYNHIHIYKNKLDNLPIIVIKVIVAFFIININSELRILHFIFL